MASVSLEVRDNSLFMEGGGLERMRGLGHDQSRGLKEGAIMKYINKCGYAPHKHL